ncbi:MAG: CDP-diacylglycerol--glycerol-3-phosphate 3-phosphatidyltransferase [Saccharofermentanales bacterium]
MNLPNKLTITRILLIPFILVFMLPITLLDPDSAWNTFVYQYGMIIATLIFGFASLTDTVDGQIARKRGIVTNMGKFLDPIADKLLVTSVMIALVQLNRITAWVAIVVIFREFIVTGIRLLAADKNVVIAASNIGKIKTIVQIIAIITIMLSTQISITFSDWAGVPYIEKFGAVILLLAVILTLLSGYDYLKKNLKFIKED